ncbi:hypothetical protein [Hydrogenophaga luteola]|uniref:DUF2147 domain-containing protein n=1 Tax=Hydrogenophaga luteola TaxID=1591122 RepID=A0ABV7W8Y2_9BURK
MKKFVFPMLIAVAMAAGAQSTNTTSRGKSKVSAPFAGSWESCGRNDSPDLCSRYLLLQRGKRICGTWSYVATWDYYDGRVVAEVVSPGEARRIRICGRPGSETSTECEAGWDNIDRPLRLCGGKLGDLDGKGGRCYAGFVRVKRPDPSLEELAAEPWVQACLSEQKEEPAQPTPSAHNEAAWLQEIYGTPIPNVATQRADTSSIVASRLPIGTSRGKALEFLRGLGEGHIDESASDIVYSTHRGEGIKGNRRDILIKLHLGPDQNVASISSYVDKSNNL